MKDFDWKEKIKELGPVKLVVVVLIGVMLLVLSCQDLFSGKSTKSDQEQAVEQTTKSSKEDYKASMERQVVELLSTVQGVGQVKVMLTLSASGKKVTLKDNEVDKDKTQEETVLVEDENPYVVQETEPVPEGILVVCQGGGDPTVQQEIIGAIEVLFHVEAHKIKVMKMA